MVLRIHTNTVRDSNSPSAESDLTLRWRQVEGWREREASGCPLLLFPRTPPPSCWSACTPPAVPLSRCLRSDRTNALKRGEREKAEHHMSVTHTSTVSNTSFSDFTPAGSTASFSVLSGSGHFSFSGDAMATGKFRAPSVEFKESCSDTGKRHILQIDKT